MRLMLKCTWPWNSTAEQLPCLGILLGAYWKFEGCTEFWEITFRQNYIHPHPSNRAGVNEDINNNNKGTRDLAQVSKRQHLLYKKRYLTCGQVCGQFKTFLQEHSTPELSQTDQWSYMSTI
ncbi:unnamed protein product [Caretta caretta]